MTGYDEGHADGRAPYRWRTVALIPARQGSERVPGKNLLRVGGKTLVQRAIESAATSRVDEVYVSSDSAEIGEEATRHGATWLPRPPELATSDSPIEDTIGHHDLDWDAMLLLNPTSPFRTRGKVDEAALLLRSHASVVSVVCDPMVHFRGHLSAPSASAGVLWEPAHRTRPRTQDLETYRESSGIFGVQRQAWEGHGRLIISPCAAVIVDQLEAIDINTALEVRCAQAIGDEATGE